MTSAELVARLESLVRDLGAADAPDEALGEFLPSRGIGPFATAEKFRALGRAWRLGVLLVDDRANLFSTGELTRAIEPGRAAVNRSAQGERRRALRAAAARSGFAAGDVVNYGFVRLDTGANALSASAGPLSMRDGVLVVQLEPGAYADLDRYLTERYELLVGGGQL
ncbi:MAG TPA: hypothetical protein VHZ81_00200 [Galbitalea sp.]|nr:hypothetical protein [Galbitalea sp.]